MADLDCLDRSCKERRGKTFEHVHMSTVLPCYFAHNSNVFGTELGLSKHGDYNGEDDHKPQDFKGTHGYPIFGQPEFP